MEGQSVKIQIRSQDFFWTQLLKPKIFCFFFFFAWICAATEAQSISRAFKLPQTQPGVSTKSNDVCLTKGCVKAAASVLEKLNETRDPCNDFYEFSCGKYVEETIIPDDKSSVSMFTKSDEEVKNTMRQLMEEETSSSDSNSTRMVKNLYHSCMNITRINATGLKSLKNVLRFLGGWPVLEGDSWKENKFSWIESNYKMKNIGYSFNYLFQLLVMHDDANSTHRLLMLDHPGLGISSEYFTKGHDADVQAYLKYSIEVAKLLGANAETVEKEMLDVLNFQRSLAKILLTSEQQRNKTLLYNVFTLQELTTKFPGIPWTTYIANILPNFIQIDENERINVRDISYFLNFTKIMEVTPKRTIANYLMWRVVADSISFLSEDIRDIQTNYMKILRGVSERIPRWKECMSIVIGILPYAVGNLYVKRSFDDNTKSEAATLSLYLKQELDQMLKSVEWMDEATQKHALKKANKMKAHIAYPKEILIDEKINEYYGDLLINDQDFLDNMLRSEIFNANDHFNKLREKIHKEDWKEYGSYVTMANAFYNPSENSIVLPAGILQKGFFDSDRPSYMNFGGIGFIIGHEITHGFDDQGKQFDEDGNLKNWWNEITENKFLNKAKCIIKQYEEYSIPENGMKINGINTQGENIADFGGLKEAYNAYQQWIRDNKPEKSLPGLSYSPNQLFWISAAQVWCNKSRPEYLKKSIITGHHPPSRFRVIGAFSNIEEFAEDWKCPMGSRMNPKNRCKVW